MTMRHRDRGINCLLLVALAVLFMSGSPARAANLYFPHVVADGRWQTELCVINNGNETVTGQLRVYNSDGQEADTALPISLGAQGRQEIEVGTAFAGAATIRYAILETSDGELSGYTKFASPGLYRAALPAVTTADDATLYIPHIASTSRWWTGIGLVNTNQEAKAVTLTFNTGVQKTITLAAGGHTSFTIKSLFGGQPQTDLESAVIENSSGIIGLELFASEADKWLSGILLSGDTAQTLYFPHVASVNGWWTGITVYNPGLEANTLTITTYDEAGAQLDTIAATVAGQGKYWGLASGLGFSSATAWFRVEGTGPLTGFELFGRPNQLGGYGGVNIQGTTGVFAKLDDEGWTGIAFVNPTASQATVSLAACDDQGNVVAASTLTLAAYEKQAKLAAQFFSADITGATFIRYGADQALVGFQLNADNAGFMLDGLPGLGLATTPVVAGQFIDAAVAGLTYASGPIAGFTDESGTFLYRAGDTVRFGVGQVVLGQGTAQSSMTPVQLVTGAGDETDPAVTNILRFLQTMDDDGDPSNGITITQAVRAQALTALDFDQSTTAFGNDPTVLALVAQLTGLTTAGTRALVGATDAQDHLQATLIAMRAGTYTGTYSGDEQGTWTALIDANGLLTAFGETVSGYQFPGEGTLTSDGTSTFVSGDAAFTATFTGLITSDGLMSGTWSETDGDRGTFTGNRQALDSYTIPGIGLVNTYKRFPQANPAASWEMTMEIIGGTVVDGEGRIIIKRSNYHNEDDVKFFVEDPEFTASVPGEIGVYEYELSDDGEDVTRCINAGEETVSVAAGSFATVKVVCDGAVYIPGLALASHTFDPNRQWTTWYSPLCGPVKDEDYWVDDPNPPLVMELQSTNGLELAGE